MLSEKDAWLFIKDSFMALYFFNNKTKYNQRGICHAINCLYLENKINLQTIASMRDKLKQYKSLHGLQAYFWRLDKEHAIYRVRLADAFANNTPIDLIGYLTV